MRNVRICNVQLQTRETTIFIVLPPRRSPRSAVACSFTILRVVTIYLGIRSTTCCVTWRTYHTELQVVLSPPLSEHETRVVSTSGSEDMQVLSSFPSSTPCSRWRLQPGGRLRPCEFVGALLRLRLAERTMQSGCHQQYSGLKQSILARPR